MAGSGHHLVIMIFIALDMGLTRCLCNWGLGSPKFYFMNFVDLGPN